MHDGCWTCALQRLGGHETFLGWCLWFEAHGKPRKAIPPEVVDVGCRFRRPDGTRYWATHQVEEPADA